MAAADIVQSGMIVGLGTGSTMGYLRPALAARRLDVRCVTSPPATERAARDLGIEVESFTGPDAPVRVDVTIDGADQVAPSGWLVKGGGASHTREKAIATAAERFVVIVSSNKLVERPAPPIPVELLEYGLGATLARLGHVRLRDVPRSLDGSVIADYLGEVDDPVATAARLSSTTRLIEHGLFAPALVSSRPLAITGPVRRMVCMEAMARASSTEAFNDVLATIVRADEVVAMDAERTLVG